MDNEIQLRLDRIEHLAEQIQCDVRAIYGYCAGMETVAKDYPPAPPKRQLFVGYGNQNKSTTLEEIKAMIVELKIKGSVRERANGLIELRTQALGSIYGRTVEEVEMKLNKALKEKKKKKHNDQFQTPTNFDKFSMYWFETFHKRKVKDNTFTHDIGLYRRYIQNTFNKFSISNVTPILLQKFIDNFSDRGKTADDLHSILNQILNSAVKHGLIKLNPLGMCFHTKHEKEHGKSLSKEDELMLLKAYDGTLYQACFALALYTGLRPNEYPTARVEGDFIKAINSKRHGKTIAYKKIPITPMLRPYICEIAKIEMPTYNQLNGRYKKIFPKGKLYDMRTTFQTRCTECGISDVAIGLFMGNSIGSELKESYTDVSEEYLLREGQKLLY